MNFAALIKDFDRVMRLFDEFHESGQWFGEVLLRSNPAFSDLQGSPEFEKHVQQNLETAEADLNQDFPLLNIRPHDRCDREDTPCPLLLVLHDNGGNHIEALQFWQPAAQYGWLVAAPRSSQAMWKDSFVWDNRKIAVQEIEKHLSTLTDNYNIRDIVLAGSGTGAETAMYYALIHADRVKGFFAINPVGPLSETPSNLSQSIQQAFNIHSGTPSGLIGVILIGQSEFTLPMDNYITIQNQLVANGINCALERMQVDSSDSPGVFMEYILPALEAMSGSE